MRDVSSAPNQAPNLVPISSFGLIGAPHRWNRQLSAVNYEQSTRPKQQHAILHCGPFSLRLLGVVKIRLVIYVYGTIFYIYVFYASIHANTEMAVFYGYIYVFFTAHTQTTR